LWLVLVKEFPSVLEKQVLKKTPHYRLICDAVQNAFTVVLDERWHP